MNKYCVVGNPIKHSKSPQIHSLFANQCDKDISYSRELLSLENFNDEILSLFSQGLRGCNVTVPFKEQAVKLCDQLTERAKLARAVNTLLRQDDGSLLGDNTDGVGFVRDLTENQHLVLKNRRILIAGAGGATRGILKPLIELSPDQILICNRTMSKAVVLADSFRQFGNVDWANYTELQDQTFDLIINATSSSLSGDTPPIPESSITNNTTLYDLAYSLEPTAFLKWGKNLGCKCLLDGSGMLAEQAAESFYLWEGVRPDTKQAIALLRQI